MENFVITFARGFGTGGKAIASQLAKELGIHCYENRILTLASQLSGLDENIFQEVNEKMRETSGFSSFLRGLPFPEMKNSYRMTSCLNIRVKLSKIWQKKSPASSSENVPIMY